MDKIFGDIDTSPKNKTPLVYSHFDYTKRVELREKLETIFNELGIDNIMGIRDFVLAEMVDNFLCVTYNTKRAMEELGYNNVIDNKCVSEHKQLAEWLKELKELKTMRKQSYTLDENDDKIRKELLEHCKNQSEPYIKTGNKCPQIQSWISWLEKQRELIDEEKVLIGARKDIALSIMNFIDRNTLGMGLSGMERADLESAVINSDWSKVHDYMKMKLEKQGESKPYWKPTDEQYEALDYAYNSCSDTERGNYYEGVLETLIEDLHRLEKQCEKEHKVEPKFKVGDWITFYGDNPFKILKVETEQNGILDYLLLNQNGYDSYYNKDYVDTNARLWTIEDAKDGDVLRIKNLTFIFQEITNNNACHKDAVIAHCSYEDNDEAFGIDGPDCITDLELIIPATKEQCNLLFQKIHEAGYNWYTDKKELKEIEQTSSWSEEDEKMVKDIIAAIDTLYYHGMVKWLKSLKERIQIQNLTVTDEELVQAKKEAYNDALNKIEYHSGEPTFDDGWSAAIWYIKKRNAQPQITWKPSS